MRLSQAASEFQRANGIHAGEEVFIGNFIRQQLGLAGITQAAQCQRIGDAYARGCVLGQARQRLCVGLVAAHTQQCGSPIAYGWVFAFQGLGQGLGFRGIDDIQNIAK